MTSTEGAWRGGPPHPGIAAALIGLVTVTLQIAYLPTLYSAFNRRETDVALLNARSGVPSWGPELLARTHYALGSGASTINTLPELYDQRERWAADIADSHTTYLPLVRFRLTTAAFVLGDRAARGPRLGGHVPGPVSGGRAHRGGPAVPARRVPVLHRSGPGHGGGRARDTDPGQGISLTYEDFLEGIATLEKVNFPVERTPADAWPDYVGWRVNYEQAAYAVAKAVDAVLGAASGPRRHPHKPIPPIRPRA